MSTRHSGTKEAWVSLRFYAQTNCGWKWKTTARLPPQRQEGIGLVAMRERAELLGGRSISSSAPADGGTLVRHDGYRGKVWRANA